MDDAKVLQINSRHQVLAELQNAGINTIICDGLSIESLNELMSGVQNILLSNQKRKTSDKTPAPKTAILSYTDRKIISKLMLSSGKVSSVALSKELDIPFTTLQRRKKKLEEKLIETNYSIRIEELGWKRATLLVSTSKCDPVAIGKEILKLNKFIVSVRKIIGSIDRDLAIEVIFKMSNDIVKIIEQIKLVSGIEQVSWIENIGPIIASNESYYEDVLT